MPTEAPRPPLPSRPHLRSHRGPAGGRHRPARRLALPILHRSAERRKVLILEEQDLRRVNARGLRSARAVWRIEDGLRISKRDLAEGIGVPLKNLKQLGEMANVGSGVRHASKTGIKMRANLESYSTWIAGLVDAINFARKKVEHDLTNPRSTPPSRTGPSVLLPAAFRMPSHLRAISRLPRFSVHQVPEKPHRVSEVLAV
jgi:hypothetical protein